MSRFMHIDPLFIGPCYPKSDPLRDPPRAPGVWLGRCRGAHGDPVGAAALRRGPVAARSRPSLRGRFGGLACRSVLEGPYGSVFLMYQIPQIYVH